ncbi:MAG: hypothetical protein IKR81_15035, partial [Victivallales bacterium]|nr:hypothetical protein [Victivallales bacterium]
MVSLQCIPILKDRGDAGYFGSVLKIVKQQIQGALAHLRVLDTHGRNAVQPHQFSQDAVMAQDLN